MRTALLLPLAFASFAAIACERSSSAGAASRDDASARSEVAAALQRYQDAARKVDADAMSATFAPTGVLFEPGIPPIVTRDSIRAFLASFPGVTVHSAIATPDTIDVFGDRAYLWGSYFEHLSFPGQPTSEQHGKFVTEWARQSDGRWLIVRMYRIPLPAQNAVTPAPASGATATPLQAPPRTG